MREILSQLSEYVWGVWRFRWIGLVIIWLVAMGGWTFVSLTPEKYLATARIDVDTNTILRPLLRGLAIQPDVDQRIALMSRTLLSRPNLEKLMRMADMDLYIKTEAGKDKMLDEILRSITLSGDRRNTSLYSVSFKHENRDIAKKVVQSLITIFVESALGDKRKDSSGAQEFLDRQIADYEQRLVDAERRLADFKQRNVGVLPGETGGYYTRLESEKSQLAIAQLQLKELGTRRDELNRQIEGEEPVFLSSQIENSPEIRALEGRIAALEGALDGLLLKYTNRHPDVVQANGMIKVLRAQKRDEEARVQATMPEQFSGLSDSPVYQQMRSMLAETEATEAELRTRVEEYQKRVNELEEKVDNIPLIESELQQLDRDYGVISAQHKTLLSRRESALISENVGLQANDVKFRVIDPPFVPQRPNEPNKVLMNAVVFVLAIGVGLGSALLLSLFRPVITTRDTLAQITGLPVLGSVMLISSPFEKKRALINNLMFFSLFGFLAVAYVGVSVFHGLEFFITGVEDVFKAVFV
ncbi:XrtA system polysaccharide chain length determinant [Neptunomonas antarctica]|uniref:Polysaccharide chain length determinant protein, PEP-CTERM locus subfamily n=1 Tax=Neptunomonas antarctica TaxID=619304 RepID=A0A1N7JDZ4_9GAMM|nr:XrtA system polysaccharide chain length determinant [Neptunomonas antarctica]SIS47565.1 polysaccharide chain length determinant protein, PEP-CTERM locus subfamily [Neptunomonas antarctica]